MKGENLRNRARKFSQGVVRFLTPQSGTMLLRTAGPQLMRSATSVGANYGEACRARSRREFISKVELAVQELQESLYWLELIVDDGCSSREAGLRLIDECKQLIALLSASARTAKRNERLGTSR